MIKEKFGFFLILHIIKYEEQENISIQEKVAPVEFSIGSANQEIESEPLIVRVNNSCDYAVVALNSFHKYYCQLCLIPMSSCNVGWHMRPINFITGEDNLPIDKCGRSSMLISDIAWTLNDNFIIVGFCSGYFCILSRFGNAVQLVSPLNRLQNQNFFIFPQPGLYKYLRFKNVLLALR